MYACSKPALCICTPNQALEKKCLVWRWLTQGLSSRWKSCPCFLFNPGSIVLEYFCGTRTFEGQQNFRADADKVGKITECLQFRATTSIGSPFLVSFRCTENRRSSASVTLDQKGVFPLGEKEMGMELLKSGKHEESGTVWCPALGSLCWKHRGVRGKQVLSTAWERGSCSTQAACTGTYGAMVSTQVARIAVCEWSGPVIGWGHLWNAVVSAWWFADLENLPSVCISSAPRASATQLSTT